VPPYAGLGIAARADPFPPPWRDSSPQQRVPASTGPDNLNTVDEVAIAYSEDPSKRAVLIAAALALVTDVVVTTQVHPALLRRVVRLAIPVVLTGPVAGILTRLGV
jgi:hypothetical protein